MVLSPFDPLEHLNVVMRLHVLNFLRFSLLKHLRVKNVLRVEIRLHESFSSHQSSFRLNSFYANRVYWSQKEIDSNYFLNKAHSCKKYSVWGGGGSAFAHKQVHSEHVSLRNSKIYICHVKPRLWSTLTVIMQFIYFVPFPRAIKSTKKNAENKFCVFFFFISCK